jgi:hypothetical protein
VPSEEPWRFWNTRILSPIYFSAWSGAGLHDPQLGIQIFACGRGLRLGNCSIPFFISSDTRQPAEPRARDRIAVRIASRSVGRKLVVRASSCTRKAVRIVPRIFTRSARGPRTRTRRAPGVAPYVERARIVIFACRSNDSHAPRSLSLG